MASGASPFRPLSLSHGDAAYLKELVHVFVQHQVESYERYLHEDHEHIDNKRWKLTLQRDNVKVFSEQAGAKGSNPVDDPGFVNQQEPPDMADLPALLAVGHMEGSLDDAMYGLMALTVDAMRLKYFYAGDQLANGAVLATIESPSATAPFQSLTVKWVEGYQPPIIRSIMHKRDFVYMEATGFTKLSDGELVGYHLLHSVHFPQTPKVGDNVRGTMSVCALYRQRNHSLVDVFARASVNSGGHISRAIATKYCATALISSRKQVHCARLKKLAWLLRTRDTGPNSTFIRGDPKCIGCGQRPGIFANGIGACSLCKRGLCTKCRLKIELGFVSRVGGLVPKKLWFCTYCLDEAARTSSRVVACGEHTDTRLYEPTPWSSGSTGVSSPSSSDRDDEWGSLDSKRYLNLLP
uniref:FYVE-type domain-containing protein n=1 Tax=Phytophthora ramorum TaxID=164328 RepID=H3GN62_PHYRM